MELLFKLTVILTILPISFSAEIPDDGLYDFVSTLAKRIDVVEASNEALSAENEDLKARIAALVAQASDHQEEIKRLTARSEDQSKINNRLEERLEKLDENDEPDTDVNQPNLRSSDKARVVSRIRKASNDVAVAFFATLTNDIPNPGENQAIPFDHVITNVGHGYNQYAGDLRAPVSGINAFSTTLQAHSTLYYYHYRIILNGHTVSNLYIRHGEAVTQDAVLHLNQGDSVSIHNIDSRRYLDGNGYTSFCGFLIHADSADAVLIGK